MTGVPDTPAFDSADADGIVTVFNFSFFVFEADDVKVYSVLDDVETEITTGITKAVDPSFIGGTVTFAVAPADALGSILIRREVAYSQTTEFDDLTRLKETAIETALNVLALQIQQVRDSADLGIQYSESAGVTDAVVETPVDGTLLMFDGILGRIKSATIASLSLTGLDTLFTSLTSGDLFSWNGVNWVNLAQLASTQIEDDAIITDKILDANVTAAKVATDAVTPVKIKSTVNAIGAIGGGTQDIDLDDGRTASATVDTATTTFTFSNPKATGNADAFDLYLTDGGSQTVNWPASVGWAGDSVPSLTASGLDHLIFTTIDGGTTWNGYVAGLDM